MPPSNNHDQNPYDFIMQGKPKPKLKIVPGGNSSISRILIVVAGFFILIILVVVLLSVLSSGKSAVADKLVQATEQQAEIIRVATIGIDKATGRDAKDLAVTTKLTMHTDQTTLLALLKKAGKGLSTKELDAITNAQDDSVLNSAEQSNQFDSSMTNLLNQLLAKYQQNLNDAYKLASPTSQPTIKDVYNHASIIIKP